MMGGDDQIVPVSNGKFLNMLIPNSELVVIQDGGHLFMLSHVEEMIAEIRGFLDGRAGSNEGCGLGLEPVCSCEGRSCGNVTLPATTPAYAGVHKI